MRRRMLGGFCGVVEVSRGPFIVQEREGKGHGRAETGRYERAAKMPIKLAALYFLLLEFDGGKWPGIIG
jgi:hypothetical protein